MYRRADKIPEGWLAKERRLAAERSRNDEIAKLRLAEAWNKLYDENERLKEENHRLVQALIDCQATLRQYDEDGA